MSADEQAVAVFGHAARLAAVLGREVSIGQVACACFRLRIDLTGADRVLEGEIVQQLSRTAARFGGRSSSSGRRDLWAEFHVGTCPQQAALQGSA
ncbi:MULTISPECIES: hypothetical protein [unclassified Kitasatospora]|uniref:hypothetical protein n=1 Tax=unclassified Kitasatospora TaxID=2633591 RepID=UPI00380E2B91